MKLALLILSLTLISLATRAEAERLWVNSVIGQNAPEFVVEKRLTNEPDGKIEFAVIADRMRASCG
jgi:hypothetical protein